MFEPDQAEALACGRLDADCTGVVKEVQIFVADDIGFGGVPEDTSYVARARVLSRIVSTNCAKANACCRHRWIFAGSSACMPGANFEGQVNSPARVGVTVIQDDNGSHWRYRTIVTPHIPLL
jgi:hypothetical protein